jgi:uncharacterized protein (DUF58 family)
MVVGGIPVSALAGALLGAEELVLAAIALSVLVAFGLAQIAVRTTRGRGDWRLSVQLPAGDAEAGGTLALLVAVTAPDRTGSAPVWLEEPRRCWRRVARASGSGDGTRSRRQALASPATVVRVPAMGSGGTASFSFPAPTLSRGVFALLPLRLWCPDSLGLVTRLLGTGPSTTISVHPGPVSIELSDDLLYGEPADSASLAAVAAPKRDSFGDFSGLRPYVPGDRLRLLYWPALARDGELVVRDFDDDGSHRVRVVADTRPLIGGPGCESVLATAASVGLQALARGSLVELSTTGGALIAIGPGPDGPRGLLRAVAHLEVGGEPATASWRSWRRRRRRGRQAGTRAPTQNLPPTAGRHLIVTTADGARTLPSTLGLADLVIAP